MKQKDKKQGCITEMCPIVWMNFYGRHFFFHTDDRRLDVKMYSK